MGKGVQQVISFKERMVGMNVERNSHRIFCCSWGKEVGKEWMGSNTVGDK